MKVAPSVRLRVSILKPQLNRPRVWLQKQENPLNFRTPGSFIGIVINHSGRKLKACKRKKRLVNYFSNYVEEKFLQHPLVN